MQGSPPASWNIHNFMDPVIENYMRQCCKSGLVNIAFTPRPSWRFEPCDKLSEPNVGFLVNDTGSLMVSLDTYKETVRLLGGTLPPSKLLTDEAKAFQKAIKIHLPTKP